MAHDLLSTDQEKRAIELALLQRIAESARAASAGALGLSFDAPVFTALARALEANVPDDATFGRFSDTQKPRL